MLEKLFIPSGLVQNSDAISENNAKWGAGFKYLLGEMNRNPVKPSTNTALLFNTVYACINVLSDDIAKLPFNVFEKVDKKIKLRSDTKAYELLRRRPNAYMTPFDLIKLTVTDVCIYGNSYTRIIYDDKGELMSLIPLDASVTRPVLDRDTGELWYATSSKNGQKLYHSHEIIHIKGASRDGIVGMSPLDAMRIQLESNEVASRYNLQMIESGGTPQGILSTPSALSKEAREEMRKAWEETNGNKKIAVVSSGLEYKQIGISQADMQWLEAQRFNNQQIASIYKVPLHKINDLKQATYSNIEHQSLDYVKNTMQPWVTKIEQEYNFKLFTQFDGKGLYTKLNMDSELRGDSKSRAEVNRINTMYGYKTLNEIRELNEDSPYEGEFADIPWMSLNLVPAHNAEAYQQNKFGQSLREGGAEEQDEENDKTSVK